jgi:hypothetical protein
MLIYGRQVFDSGQEGSREIVDIEARLFPYQRGIAKCVDSDIVERIVHRKPFLWPKQSNVISFAPSTLRAPVETMNKNHVGADGTIYFGLVERGETQGAFRVVVLFITTPSDGTGKE